MRIINSCENIIEIHVYGRDHDDQDMNQQLMSKESEVRVELHLSLEVTDYKGLGYALIGTTQGKSQ